MLTVLGGLAEFERTPLRWGFSLRSMMALRLLGAYHQVTQCRHIQFVMRLLIIEDDRADADYMARAFRELGHSADLAADGEAGLAHALASKYDVIIVDRRLPKPMALRSLVLCAARASKRQRSFYQRSARSTIESKGCGLVAMTICPSPIRFQSFWRVRRSWRGRDRAKRKWSIVSATSSSIVCRVK